MKYHRLISLLVGAFVLGGTALQAQAVVLFLDLGDSSTGVQGGPIDYSNPAVEAQPGETFSLYLWAIPDADDNKVVASLGHDVDITGTAAVTALQYTLDNPDIGANTRWNGIALLGGLNQDGNLVSDQRAVFVPTEEPFVGGVGSRNLAGDPGYDANSGAVYLGQLDLQIDPGAEVGSTAELRLVVSPLLIAQVTTGTWEDEPISFGYRPQGNEPSPDTGSVVGATTAIADATITVVASGTPGDCDGDGDVDLTDFLVFQTCYTGPDGGPVGPECDPVDFDDDGDVDLQDFLAFQTAYTGPGGGKAGADK